jgi:VWFA-related protein
VTAPTVAQEPTFRAQSNVVTVPALVKDGKGNIVYGLQAQDFIIEDDGAIQEARLDESEGSEPISVVLVLQVGRRAFREFPRIRGLSTMLNPIFSQPRSQVAIVEFDSAVSLVQDFTNRESSIADQLEQTRSGDGGAAILDAVQYSVHLLDHTPEGHRRVMLLISETRDHGSHIARIKDVVTEVGNSNTVVYALPFSPSLSQVLDTERGSNRDEWRSTGDLLAPLMMASQAVRKNTPKAIAAMTGGEYEVFASRKSFEKLLTDFTNHLHSRYLLSFQPKNPHPGLHEIRVRLREPEEKTILARSSYWAEGERQ